MSSREFIDRLHDLSIEKYGGLKGLRDEGLLESAIARPFQTFDRQYLYRDQLDKAAAIGESIIMNHPYLDGNKRTGFLAMFALLNAYGMQFTAPEDEAYRAMIQVSTGEMGVEGLKEWLLNNTNNI